MKENYWIYLANEFSFLGAVTHWHKSLVCWLVGELDKHTLAISSFGLSTLPIDFFRVEKILRTAPDVFAVVASVCSWSPQLNVHHRVVSCVRLFWVTQFWTKSVDTLRKFREASVPQCGLNGNKLHVKGAAVIPSITPSHLFFCNFKPSLKFVIQFGLTGSLGMNRFMPHVVYQSPCRKGSRGSVIVMAISKYKFIRRILFLFFNRTFNFTISKTSRLE